MVKICKISPVFFIYSTRDLVKKSLKKTCKLNLFFIELKLGIQDYLSKFSGIPLGIHKTVPDTHFINNNFIRFPETLASNLLNISVCLSAFTRNFLKNIRNPLSGM